METIWPRIKKLLEQTLSPGLYNLWIKPLTARARDGVLELAAPNAFVASWVRERLADSVVEAAAVVMGSRPQLVVTEAARTADAPAAAPAATAPRPARAPRSLTLPMAPKAPDLGNDRFRFSYDEFVVGPSNELAYVASQGICDMSLSADQLFISSAPGLGKTHLIQAMGKRLSHTGGEDGRNLRVAYLSAEEFANRLVIALKTRQVEKFKAAFRENVDVLLLEDIHFFRDKPRIQDELLNTLIALNSRGCRLVFTSSFLPRDLAGLDAQLLSRISSGFLTVIDKPDLATRKRILERKAAVHQVLLPDEVSTLLADRLHADVRQLESCLQNLALKARLLNCRISVDLAWDVLRHYDLEARSLTLEDIVEYVCDVYRLSADQLVSKSRKRQYVLARNTAFLLARQHTDMSLVDIGNRFNRRHSTVVKGITSLERHLSLRTPLGRELERTIESVRA
ncbi:Chromosomal replication initiator DnaA [Solidesulfovibrio carbinoliphilus subsp. oakridgensis]|uniref:Chromosomal replication initiator protein DnaA n=1 Tax=Solidesulfovibrio carbinoliphilus subsp. oakridgensis TaxID=694327 RepID=G7QBY3_9BACT|nr:chromosomal replication initiator protein DnaA [Solidesulfovibrio carbinoliphilus]EHJ46018.1 Chromosomal replication initiator DnaA [Solidesulfovibrio carbinoliphilus subsp. oakridgensis]